MDFISLQLHRDFGVSLLFVTAWGESCPSYRAKSSPKTLNAARTLDKKIFGVSQEIGSGVASTPGVSARDKPKLETLECLRKHLNEGTPREEVTQQVIAKELLVAQTTISRRLKRFGELLGLKYPVEEWFPAFLGDFNIAKALLEFGIDYYSDSAYSAPPPHYAINELNDYLFRVMDRRSKCVRPWEIGGGQ